MFLSKSNGSVMVLAAVARPTIWQPVPHGVFGPLRPVEVETFTIFRDDFGTPFTMSFGILLSSSRSSGSSLTGLIGWTKSLTQVSSAYGFTPLHTVGHGNRVAILRVGHHCNLRECPRGPTLLFASEYAILLASCMNAWLKYSIAYWDFWRARRRGRENAPVWEDKSMFVFYVELLSDFMKLITYLTFFGVIMGSYGLPLSVIPLNFIPLNVIYDVYVTARSFLSQVQDLVRYRTATKNMDQRYPNAT
ncbi:E3 ubiquitin-protein ligase hrd1 [Tulasnella sp. 424]|nr:E3 ubiquitin-protein ligase hrd1 [Tulasnella sp. 424]KAG8972634.1 E3 ubiquitin-protein ligase hrd1 [Tulasnella sp. 425]